MKITPELLIAAMGCTPANAARFAEPLGAACAFYGIDTPARLAAFLAQVAHESGALRYATELWGPTPAQQRYERDTSQPWPASREEAARAEFHRNALAFSLGNTQSGDGARFKGHGLIQTTGRYNHARVRDRLRARFADVPDFEAEPQRLAEPQWAALSAADYWDDHGINAYADRGDFDGVCDLVNRGRKTAAEGDSNGYTSRLAYWKRATRAISGIAPVAAAAPPVAAPPAPAEPPVPPQAASFNSGGFMPAGEGSPQETTTMLPFVAAAIPALIDAAPSLIRIFGDSPQAEKNAKAAEAVAEIAKKATGQDTVEAAVNAIQQDPAAAASYREAVHLSMSDLVSMMERVNAMEQSNIAAARTYNAAEPLMIDAPWLKLKFIHVLSIAFVCFSGWFVIQHWATLTPELRGAVITLMIIAGWNGVRDYWMGSSSGSDRKTELIDKRGQ